MRVDVDRGDLVYSINGKHHSELRSNEMIKGGVYLAATIYNTNAQWTILSSELS